MEKFFQACISLGDELETKELILHRYHDPNYIFSLEIPEFIQLVKKAKEKEIEERIREQWVTMLPFMSLKMLNYMPFEEYFDRCTGRNIDLRPTDEIIRDIEETHKRVKGGE